MNQNSKQPSAVYDGTTGNGNAIVFSPNWVVPRNAVQQPGSETVKLFFAGMFHDISLPTIPVTDPMPESVDSVFAFDRIPGFILKVTRDTKYPGSSRIRVYSDPKHPDIQWANISRVTLRNVEIPVRTAEDVLSQEQLNKYLIKRISGSPLSIADPYMSPDGKYDPGFPEELKRVDSNRTGVSDAPTLRNCAKLITADNVSNPVIDSLKRAIESKGVTVTPTRAATPPPSATPVPSRSTQKSGEKSGR